MLVTPILSAPAKSSGEINVAELLQKLMATGIMTPLEEKAKNKEKEKPTQPDSPLIRPVDFKKPETLKTRQTALVAHLYSGIQCNSCGVRFPPEQTMRYSQHLDWHFRQNRRDKDSARSAQTRRYYYDVSDWVQFEEIEDLEERAQPWFEMQEGGGEEEEETVLPMTSVRAADYPEDASCHICHDKFESFYNEEKEEWQLRNAEDIEDNLVHPVCWADQQTALAKPIVVDDLDVTEDEASKEEEKNEEEKDDDIMEVMDLEIVKPVFPVEDLTVSDSESVADKDEIQTGPVEDEKVEEEEEKTEENQDELIKECDFQKEVEGNEQEPTEGMEKYEDEAKKEGEETEEDMEKQRELEKDEDTQDEVIAVEKGEDSNSILSSAEIMEVVKNIKKDPDALGGEFEDTEMKTDRGEVPLPAPVVHTTQTSVNCLIDGNVEFDETPQQSKVSGPSRIKINITKPVVQANKDKEEEVMEDTQNSMLPATLALVSQPPPPGEEPVPQSVKPRLIGKKLQELPPVLKGSELSGLCSIM